MEIRTPNLAQRICDRVADMAIVRLLPAKTANLIQCRRQGMWNRYFQEAEASFGNQWESIIWPLVKAFDFSTVLQLAPGAGRNTQKLCTIATRIIAVDYNEYALEQTRVRLGSFHGGCEIS